MGQKNTHKTKLRRVKRSTNKKKKIAEQDWEHLVEFIGKYNLDTHNTEPERDFDGTFVKDNNSALRKRILRIKASVTDPIILGRILGRSGNRRVPFVADTGCSVNILPARFAAISGLKWQDVAKDEAIFMSATNQYNSEADDNIDKAGHNKAPS